MKVLFALLYNEDIQELYKGLEGLFIDKGYDVESELVTSLFDLRNAASTEYDAIIIQEHIERRKKVEIDDLDFITDKAEGVKLIFVMDNKHRGASFARRLFELGVYTGVFAKDAEYDGLVRLAVSGRSKKDAKTYYKLVSENDSNDIKPLTDKVLKNDINIISNSSDALSELKRITDKYSTEQKKYLLTSLPLELLDVIAPDYQDVLEGGNDISETVYKTVRETVVVHQMPDDYKKVITVMGLEPRIGTTTIACELAQYYSRQGVDVAIIDVDLAKFEVFYRFKCKANGDNMISYLLEDRKREAFGESLDNHLSVYSDYYKMRNSPFNEQLGEALSHLIRIAKEENRIVILDVPYMQSRQSEIDAILSASDNVLLVLNQNPAVLDRLEHYKKALNGRVVDFIINNFDLGVRQYLEKQIGTRLNRIGIGFNRSFTLEYSNLVSVALQNKETVVKQDLVSDFSKSIADVANYYFSIYNQSEVSTKKSKLKRNKTTLGFSKIFRSRRVEDLGTGKKATKSRTRGLVEGLSGHHTIAVMGTDSSVGVTHTALMICFTYSKHNKVAYVDLSQGKKFQSLKKHYGIKSDENSFKLKGIVFYEDSTIYNEITKYDVVVFDYGDYRSSVNNRSFEMASRKIICCDSNIYNQGALVDFCKAYRDSYSEYSYVLRSASKSELRGYREYLDSKKVFSMPHDKDVFNPSAHTADTIDKLVRSTK